jgi:hypothetical protein
MKTGVPHHLKYLKYTLGISLIRIRYKTLAFQGYA